MKLVYSNGNLFTASEIKTLRHKFDEVETMNTNGALHRGVTDFLRNSTVNVLEQLASAKIRWLSAQAQFHLVRGDYKIVDPRGIQHVKRK